MANQTLIEKVGRLIAARQEELKNYQGAELFRKMAELKVIRQIYAKNRNQFQQESQAAKTYYENWENGVFSDRRELTIAKYAVNYAKIYDKTGLSKTQPLPSYALKEENPEEKDYADYYADHINEFTDETAARFQRKFYEKGESFDITVYPGERTFENRNFAGYATEILSAEPDGLQSLAYLTYLMKPDKDAATRLSKIVLAEDQTVTLPDETQLNKQQVDALINHVLIPVRKLEGNLNQNLPEELRNYGINPLSLIRVGGLTAEEKWGSKYAAIENEEHKKLLYELELANAIANGQEEISVDLLTTTKDRAPEVKGRVTLLRSHRELARTKVFLNEISLFNQSFRQSVTGILQQDVPVEPQARELYQQMVESAQKVLMQSTLSEEGASYDGLNSAYNEFLEYTSYYFGVQSAYMRAKGVDDETIQTLGNKINSLLGKISLSKDQLDVYAKALPVRHSDNPVKNAADFEYNTLLQSFGPTASLRRWPQESLLLEGVEPLPANLAWMGQDNILDFEEIQSNHPSENNPDYYESLQNVAGFLPDDPDFLAIGKHLQTLNVDENAEVKESFRQRLKNSGLNDDRPVTVQNVFLMWAMAKKGLSVEEASKLYRAHIPVINDQGVTVYPPERDTLIALEREYIRFVTENPFNERGATKEKLTQNVKAWAGVFHGAKEQIEKYRIPDIDYSDPGQVKPHQEVLRFLTSVGADGIQEFERLMEESNSVRQYFDPYRVGGEEIGGEEKIHDIRPFFLGLQGIGYIGYDLPHAPLPADNKGRVTKLAEKGFYRSVAGQAMKFFAGKSIKDAVRENEGLLLHMESDLRQNLFSDMANPDSEHPLPLKESMASLAGFNQTALNRTSKRYMEDYFAESRNTIIQSQLSTGLLKGRANPVPDEIENRFRTQENDADSMLNFLNDTVLDGVSGKDWVSLRFSEMIHGRIRASLKHAGIKESSIFLADGRTPEQLWGNKYANIQDPEQKEWLYRAEILKAMALGNRRISVRTYRLNEEGRVTEGKRVALTMKKPEMNRMVQDYKKYYIEKNNLISMLKEMRKDLAATQEDGNANFGNNDNLRTGSSHYQNYCVALRNALNVLERTNVTRADIRGYLVTLQDAAGRYYENRKGIFSGPRSDSGIIRLNNSAKIKDHLVEKWDEWCEFEQNSILISRPVTTTKDAWESKLHDVMLGINAGLKNHAIDFTMEQDSYVRQNLSETIARLKRDERFKAISEKSEEAKRASRYFMTYLENKLKGRPGVEEPEKLKYELLRRAEHFFEEVSFLEKNITFQKFMKENPEGCIRTWETVENAADRVKTEYANKLSTYTGFGRTASRYVGDISVQDDIGLADKIRANAQAPNPVPLATYYNRLADMVMAQMLSSDYPKARDFALAIAKGNLTREELKQQIVDYATAHRLLEGRNLSKTENALDSETLDVPIATALAANREALLKTENEAKETEAGRIGGILAFIDRNHGSILSQAEWNTYMANTNFMVGSKETKDLTLAAGRLTMRHVTDKYPQGIQLRDNEYRKVSFSATRPHSIQADFIIWTMGHKNMSFTDALAVCNTIPVYNGQGEIVNQAQLKASDELRVEFFEFTKDHPVEYDGILTPEQQEANYKAWAEVFDKATQKMKEYRIPDINYRNIEELKQHLPELMALTNLTINVSQDYSKLFCTTEGIDGERVARETLDIGRYEANMGFWWSVGNAFPAFDQGFFLSLDSADYAGEAIGKFQRAIHSYAPLREVGVRQMQNCAGLTMDQVTGMVQSKGLNLYNKKIANNHIEQVVENKRPDLDLKLETAYLQGAEPKEFEAAMKNWEKMSSQNTRDTVRDRISGDLHSAVMLMKFDGQKEVLKNLPEDDPRAMMDYLNSPAEERIQINNRPDIVKPLGTGKDVVSRFVHRFVSGGTISSMLADARLKFSEAFLVDGQTLREKYADKYASVRIQGKPLDEKQLEDLYRLEFVRDMAKGEAVISCRTFKFEGERLTEARPVDIRLSPERHKQLAGRVYECEQGMNDILSELTRFRTEFMSTQPNNPNANFFGEETEGNTKEYKEMTRALRFAISAFQNDLPEDVIKTRLTGLAAAAKTYHDTHTGFFGGEPSSPNGQKRYRLSDEMYTTVTELAGRYMRLRRGFPADIVTSNGSVKNTSVYHLKRYVNEVARINEIPLKNAEEYRQDYLGHELEHKLNRTFRNQNVELPGIGDDAVFAAHFYMIRAFENKIANRTVSYADIKTINRPEERIRELATNRTFLKMMSKEPQRCVNEWTDIEARAAQSVQRSTEKLNEIKSRYGSLSAYVAGLPEKDPVNHPGPYSKNELRTSLAGIRHRNNEEEIFRMYTRLTEVVLFQQISENSEEGKRLRYEFAKEPYRDKEHPGLYREMFVFVTASLKEDGMLGSPEWNALLKSLEKGEFKEAVWENLIKDNMYLNKEKEPEHNNSLEDMDVTVHEGVIDNLELIDLEDGPRKNEKEFDLKEVKPNKLVFGEEISFIKEDEYEGSFIRQKPNLIIENDEDDPESGDDLNIINIKPGKNRIIDDFPDDESLIRKEYENARKALNFIDTNPPKGKTPEEILEGKMRAFAQVQAYQYMEQTNKLMIRDSFDSLVNEWFEKPENKKVLETLVKEHGGKELLQMLDTNTAGKEIQKIKAGLKPDEPQKGGDKVKVEEPEQAKSKMGMN